MGVNLLTSREPISYKTAGVDVETGEIFAARLSFLLQSTWNNKIQGEVSGFKAVYDHGDSYLLGAADGVGTKLDLAFLANKHDTIGEDLVAMCVNDLARVGAKPLFFLDYLSVGKLSLDVAEDIIKGITAGCRKAAVPLIGGETAEMPGMYQPGKYDLAGFAVGEVNKEQIIDGRKVRPGAAILGVESSGLHSNGYSLARKVIFDIVGYHAFSYIPTIGKTVAEELLTPTIIYTPSILKLLQEFPQQIQGMAHITGGGMPNKLPRALPAGLSVIIKEGSWPVPPVFEFIQEKGLIKREEMRKTFNMGIGFVLLVNEVGIIPELQQKLLEDNLNSYLIGTVYNKKEKVCFI